MTTVLIAGTAGAGFLYILAGVFGIVAFAACRPSGYPLNYNKEPVEPWSYKDIMEI